MRQPLPLCVPCVFCPVPGDSRHLHINYILDKGMPGYVKGTSLAVQVISEVDIPFSTLTFFRISHVVCAEVRHPRVLCSRGVGWGRSEMLCCVLASARERSCAFGFLNISQIH